MEFGNIFFIQIRFLSTTWQHYIMQRKRSGLLPFCSCFLRSIASLGYLMSCALLLPPKLPASPFFTVLFFPSPSTHFTHIHFVTIRI
jgi:hypothetical protein